jgi:hypothetical protein
MRKKGRVTTVLVTLMKRRRTRIEVCTRSPAFREM